MHFGPVSEYYMEACKKYRIMLGRDVIKTYWARVCTSSFWEFQSVTKAEKLFYNMLNKRNIQEKRKTMLDRAFLYLFLVWVV